MDLQQVYDMIASKMYLYAPDQQRVLEDVLWWIEQIITQNGDNNE